MNIELICTHEMTPGGIRLRPQAPADESKLQGLHPADQARQYIGRFVEGCLELVQVGGPLEHTLAASGSNSQFAPAMVMTRPPREGPYAPDTVRGMLLAKSDREIEIEAANYKVPWEPPLTMVVERIVVRAGYKPLPQFVEQLKRDGMPAGVDVGHGETQTPPAPPATQPQQSIEPKPNPADQVNAPTHPATADQRLAQMSDADLQVLAAELSVEWDPKVSRDTMLRRIAVAEEQATKP